MRILFIAPPRQGNSLLPVLKERGLTIELAPALEPAGFKLETRNYEAVLVDQKPETVEAELPRWRRAGLKAHIIVLLPRSSSALDRAHCLDAGADVSLTHPIDTEELCAHLRALQRRHDTGNHSVQRVHDLEINLAVRSVYRAGKQIHLTPREFDLLYLLAANQGKVLTASIIRERLFDGLENSCSNIVTVYIRYLRNKIDDGFELPLILTRWGQGYLMRPEAAAVE
jgi:DNA-binding response OmpR family regulator